MKRLLWVVPVILLLAITFGASIVSAQEGVTFDTSFAFRLDTQVYQPGTYAVRLNDDQTLVTITSSKGVTHAALALTRLAEPDPRLVEGKVVFDKAGEVYYLSEVWIPELDGFLLHITKGMHTHVKVKLAKKG
jgi:hypothetical protein